MKTVQEVTKLSDDLDAVQTRLRTMVTPEKALKLPLGEMLSVLDRSLELNRLIVGMQPALNWVIENPEQQAELERFKSDDLVAYTPDGLVELEAKLK